MAIPVHVPYEEGLIRDVARPDDSLWVRFAQSPFELGGFREAIVHQSVNLVNEAEVIGRIQEQRGPCPAWPQRFHHPHDAEKATGSRLASPGSVLQAHRKVPT